MPHYNLPHNHGQNMERVLNKMPHTEDFTDIAFLFQQLGDPTRLRILGFGCTVPAIMASRALENRRDRFKVMLITPFMSCSARLPIYILFAEMFFQEHAMLVTALRFSGEISFFLSPRALRSFLKKVEASIS